MIDNKCDQDKIESLLVDVMRSTLVGLNDIGLGMLGVYDNFTAFQQAMDCLSTTLDLISKSGFVDEEARAIRLVFDGMKLRIKNEYESKQA